MGPGDYTARVDEAASFVVGERVELVPAAVVRGLDVTGDGTGRDLVMPAELDLFR